MASLPSQSSADRVPEATDLLQKMTLDSQPKAADTSDASKKTSVNQFGAGDSANGQARPYELSTTPVLPDFVDPNMVYMPNGYPSAAYFYGAYDGNDWSEYNKMMSAEGVDIHSASYGYGYPPYGPYSPVASPVPDYGAQHYQYPTSYYQPMNANSGSFTPKSANTQSDANKSAPADQKASVENSSRNSGSNMNGGGSKVNNTLGSKPVYGNSSYYSNGSATGNHSTTVFPASSYYESKSVFDGVRSLWQDSAASDGQAKSKLTSTVAGNRNGPSTNPILRPNNSYEGLQQTRQVSGIGASQGFMNDLYPSKLYAQYGNAYRHGMYGSYAAYDSRTHAHGWSVGDAKYRPRGRGYGFYTYSNQNADGLNELNRGPRAKGAKNVKELTTPVTLAVKGQALPIKDKADDEKDGLSVATNTEHYNQPDFPIEYENAKFFIIKSYSEDDVHKSIKYNMWASTPNGNKKLDAAYREAQEISGGCPVFLFFSVNASGQFVGVAEMVGPVDFDKTLDYWQQNKWNGGFPLSWKIVKDVPNMLLKHIILANNENKPVTNSRDTQEVKLEQGLQMLKIFKEHVSRTSIVDDFGFYEARQKAIQEKKAKQQQFQKQVWEGKLAAEEKKDGANEKLNLQDAAASEELVKEPQPQTHVSVP